MTDKHERFRQASEYTGFHKKLGVLIDPYLNEKWTMADVGCGLALLDFQIAGSVASITAIDIDASALAAVENHIDDELTASRNDAGKIRTLLKDASALGADGARWDVMLLSFFGATFEELDRLLSLANHRGIVIMHGQVEEGIFDPIPSPDKQEKSADKLEAYLTRSGYGFRKSIVDLQFGQPFRAIDDIHEFLRSYEAERLIYSVEERIIKTKRYDFPYYLPRNLRVAIFIIDTHR
jgi:hypothetical protein